MISWLAGAWRETATSVVPVRGMDDPAAAYKFDLQGYIKIKGCVMHRWAPSLRCCRYQCSPAAAVSSAVGRRVSQSVGTVVGSAAPGLPGLAAAVPLGAVCVCHRVRLAVVVSGGV